MLETSSPAATAWGISTSSWALVVMLYPRRAEDCEVEVKHEGLNVRVTDFIPSQYIWPREFCRRNTREPLDRVSHAAGISQNGRLFISLAVYNDNSHRFSFGVTAGATRSISEEAIGLLCQSPNTGILESRWIFVKHDKFLNYSAQDLFTCRQSPTFRYPDCYLCSGLVDCLTWRVHTCRNNW